MVDRRVFESIKVVDSSPTLVRETVQSLRGRLANLELDHRRGSALQLADRRWMFVLEAEANRKWNRIGKEPVTVGVVANNVEGIDAPFVQWVLVAVPGARGSIQLELRDSEMVLLGKGTATLRGDDLEFQMPITRPGANAKGIMSGVLTSDGQIRVKESRLPKPLKKREPKLVSED